MRRLPLILLLAVLFALPGCSKKSTNPSQTDEEAIQNITSDSDWFKLTSYYEGEAVSDSGDTTTTPGKARCDTLRVLWGRRITDHRGSELDIHITGDSAFVSWTIKTMGYFHIVKWSSDSGHWVHLKKPLSETAHLYAIFRRRGEATLPNRGWELAKISGAEGRSDSVCTVGIESILIQSSSYDTTVTDPLELTDIADVFTFVQGEEVTLTVQTENEGPADLFLHVFTRLWPWHIRIPFQNNGDGTYTGTWRVQRIPAVRFAVFDLLRHETIYANDYPYDFNGWLFPYLVKVPASKGDDGIAARFWQ